VIAAPFKSAVCGGFVPRVVGMELDEHCRHWTVARQPALKLFAGLLLNHHPPTTRTEDA
jgi:hypothetical protein